MLFLYELLLAILDGLFQQNTLHTQKIDKHIEELKQHQWFLTVFNDEAFHRLFFVNWHVRKYLQSRFRVRRLMKSTRARESFINLLQTQVKK